MAETSYEVLWPLGKLTYETTPLAHAAQDLRGKTICELWDWVFRGEEIFPTMREMLARRYPGVKFVDYEVFGNTHGPDERERIAKLPERLREHGCDLVVSGVGN
ncbi:MAG: hypothetical protein HYX92_16865 [Chloroflexi bacterium]|nr:hypothetical protein [Chloroflexota bacterium]